jgi:hypothetical protein
MDLAALCWTALVPEKELPGKTLRAGSHDTREECSSDERWLVSATADRHEGCLRNTRMEDS